MRSYLPVNLKANLMQITFPSLIGQTHDLLARTRQIFLKRDNCAPIYITKDNWEAFEDRDDIKSL